MNKKTDLRILENKLKFKSDVNESEIFIRTKKKELKKQIKISYLNDKRISNELKIESLNNKNNNKKNLTEGEKKIKELKKEIKQKEQQALMNKKSINLSLSKFKKNLNKKIFMEQKEQQKIFISEEKIIDEQIKKLEQRKEILKKTGIEDLDKIKNSFYEFKEELKGQINKEKITLVNLTNIIKKQRKALKLNEFIQKMGILQDKKEEFVENKKRKISNKYELNKLMNKYKEKEIKLQKEEMLKELNSEKEIIAISKQVEKTEKEIKQLIKIRKISELNPSKYYSWKQRREKEKLSKLYSSYSKFNLENAYLTKKSESHLRKINNRNISIEKFKRNPELYEKIKFYETIKKNEHPIGIKVLIKNTLMIDKIIVENKKLNYYQESLMLALLSGYTLELGKWFIKLSNKKNEFVEKVDNSIFKNFSLFNDSLRNEFNKLINYKLEIGSPIEIYDGLILLQKNNQLIILENTKVKG